MLIECDRSKFPRSSGAAFRSLSKIELSWLMSCGLLLFSERHSSLIEIYATERGRIAVALYFLRYCQDMCADTHKR